MKINPTRIILVLFLLCVGSVHAQNELSMKPLSERIDEATKKLQLKLVLSNEQLIKIDSILIQSIPKSIAREKREETIKSINSKIEAMLTTKQLSKFAIIKSKWLDEILSSAD